MLDDRLSEDMRQDTLKDYSADQSVLQAEATPSLEVFQPRYLDDRLSTYLGARLVKRLIKYLVRNNQRMIDKTRKQIQQFKHDKGRETK